jgi:hypothetical protein
LIEPIAKDADLLVHEATNAYIQEFERGRSASPQVVKRSEATYKYPSLPKNLKMNVEDD